MNYEEVALNGGFLCYGKLAFNDVPADFDYRYIATKGEYSGDKVGMTVLIGKTPRGKALCKEGFINRCMSNYGISRELATEIVSASDGVRYGREGKVLYAIATILSKNDENVGIWADLPLTGYGTRNALMYYDLDDFGLSVPRLEAVSTIVARVTLGHDNKETRSSARFYGDRDSAAG